MKSNLCVRFCLFLEKIFKFLFNLKTLCYTILFIILIIFFVFILNPQFLQPWMSHLISHNLQDEYTWFYYFISSTITAVLAIIAVLKLSKISHQVGDDFLIRIDARWESAEKTKGRIYLQELIIEEKAKIEGYDKVGKKIIELSQNAQDSEKFIHILHIIDFMETIGYLYNKEEAGLNKDDIKELFGDSLKTNYKIFKPYIKYVRNFKGSKKMYREFQDMYKDINGRNPDKDKP